MYKTLTPSQLSALRGSSVVLFVIAYVVFTIIVIVFLSFFKSRPLTEPSLVGGIASTDEVTLCGMPKGIDEVVVMRIFGGNPKTTEDDELLVWIHPNCRKMFRIKLDEGPISPLARSSADI